MKITHWLAGARPHTWANAFAPVIAGTAAAQFHTGITHYGKAFLAVIVAWALIIGVNYANDYSDGIRGTDNDRTGPLRLTASGTVPPQYVKAAAFCSFAVAGIAGTILSLLSQPWLIAIGLCCVLAAWFYTGGKNPYGYRGLGEVAIFIFFGLVAVLGTEYTQTGKITGIGIGLAISIGAISSAVNLANNLRDIPTDRDSGKITLAVRLGDLWTRRLWLGLITGAIALGVVMGILTALTRIMPGVALAMLPATTVPLFISAAQPILHKAQGAALIPVLGRTGKGLLFWSCAAFAASWVAVLIPA